MAPEDGKRNLRSGATSGPEQPEVRSASKSPAERTLVLRSVAAAQFFTNARSMVAFSKIVAIYPSVIASYDDPFFSTTGGAIEDSARSSAKDVVSHYADIVPDIPSKADVNDIVLKAVESAIFNGVDPQKALSDAVIAADKFIK